MKNKLIIHINYHAICFSPAVDKLANSDSSDEYNPWGRGGGGAPIRDSDGNLMTSTKGKGQRDFMVS